MEDAKEVPGATVGDQARRERVIAYSVLLAGALALLVVHWPGLLDPDALATITQARSGWIGDHRSALATWVWREVEQLIGEGAAPFFLLQTAVLFSGLYLVLRGALRRIPASLATVAVIWSPWSAGFAGSVGRDIWFIGGCLLALGLAIAATRWPRRLAIAALAVGALATVAATASRQNGVTAVLPLAVGLAAAAWTLLPPGSRMASLGGGRRLVAVGVAATALTLVGPVVTLLATPAVRRVHENPQVYTQLWDLGFMTLERDEQMIPPLPRTMQPVQTVEEVRERWFPHQSLYMRFNRDGTLDAELYSDAAASELSDAWKDAILDHPALYLRGRTELWLRQLGIGFTPEFTYISGEADDQAGKDLQALPAASHAVVDYARFWSTSGSLGGVIYHAWVGLLICIAGLWLLAPRFPLATRMVGLLAASAITAQIGLFLIAPSVQWRYQLLTAYAALVVSCVAIALIWRGWRASARSARPDSATR